MKKRVLLMLCLLSAPLVSVAEQCGVISSKVLSLAKDEYRVIITNVGKPAQRIDGQVAMKPGRHRFKVLVVSSGTPTNNSETTLQYAGSQWLSDTLEFELDVKADMVYRLIAKVEDKAVAPRKRRYEVVVRNEVAKRCDEREVLSHTFDVKKSDLELLPPQLQYRLSLLMKDIGEYYRKQGVAVDEIELTGKGGIIDVLGIVIDYQAPVQAGLKVLAVTPTSAAATIGLKPDDVIIKANELSFVRSNMTHQQMAQALKLMFKHLSADKSGHIEVERGGQVIDLPVYFKQVSLPKYYIQLQLE